jgi:plasmid stabilization system protein ParE
LKPLKIIRGEEAISDAADIHLFIAMNNPDAADRFLDAVRLTFRTLARWRKSARSTNPTAPN